MTVPIAAVQVQVFAIEMVYVPQGAFFVGDSSFTNINNQFARGGSIEPFLITSENQLTLGGTNTNTSLTATISVRHLATTSRTRKRVCCPPLFPKGFGRFIA